MNKAQAEAWVKELTDLLSGKTLVAVVVGPGGRVDVLLDQKFERAYVRELQDDEAVVALVDSHGAMMGAEKWSIDPDMRTVKATTTSRLGDLLIYTWTIVDGDWETMYEARRRLRKVR